MYVCMYVHIDMHVYVYLLHICVCRYTTYVCVYKYVDIYTQTYYTYIHTYAYSETPSEKPKIFEELDGR